MNRNHRLVLLPLLLSAGACRHAHFAPASGQTEQQQIQDSYECLREARAYAPQRVKEISRDDLLYRECMKARGYTETIKRSFTRP